MPKNLVLLFDGTNNEFGEANTNVVRLAQILRWHPEQQLVYYDPGVGTLPEPGVATSIGKRISEIYGLAFGTGLTGKVERAYSYLMDFWEPGDRVYLFGFSRGAYTARVLAAMLHTLGLLPKGNHNLVPYAMRLFKSVRTGYFRRAKYKANYWRLCNLFRKTFARPVSGNKNTKAFRVHFLGAWDTVSSVGWVWDPASFPFTTANPSVSIVRHAVAIDERRWFFRQNLFKQPKRSARGSGEPQDLIELWFPGVHADVGGGYSETDGRLWRAPLEWMARQAHDHSLLFNEDRLAEIFPSVLDGDMPWADDQHESLTWKWWPAEFFPKRQWQRGSGERKLRIGLGRRRTIEDNASLHESVVLRMHDRPDYRPPNLPL